MRNWELKRNENQEPTFLPPSDNCNSNRKLHPSFRHHLREAMLRAQNHRGKIPGAGRRVQCGAQPVEASKTLTRRPATYNRL